MITEFLLLSLVFVSLPQSRRFDSESDEKTAFCMPVFGDSRKKR